VFIRYTLNRIPCIDITYLLATGKWSSGIRAFAPAATAARVNVTSIYNVAQRLTCIGNLLSDAPSTDHTNDWSHVCLLT
jgi:hypothetical protein